MMTILTFIPILLTFMLKMMGMFIMYTMSSSKEKKTPFECGFDPNSKARLPFSLQFFLLAVIFLIFDIEIVILLGLPIMMKTKLSIYYMYPTFTFIMILILGLYHEWNEGSLNWKMM